MNKGNRQREADPPQKKKKKKKRKDKEQSQKIQFIYVHISMYFMSSVVGRMPHIKACLMGKSFCKINMQHGVNIRRE